jgi:hypothetical protein
MRISIAMSGREQRDVAQGARVQRNNRAAGRLAKDYIL